MYIGRKKLPKNRTPASKNVLKHISYKRPKKLELNVDNSFICKTTESWMQHLCKPTRTSLPRNMGRIWKPSRCYADLSLSITQNMAMKLANEKVKDSDFTNNILMSFRVASKAFRSSQLDNLQTSSGSMSLQYAWEFSLINFITRKKLNENSHINDKLDNRTHFEKSKPNRAWPSKAVFLSDFREAMTNKNLSISSLMKLNENRDSSWNAVRIFICD